MEPFIKSEQYNFIKLQTQILINGHATANDKDVVHTVKSVAKERVLKLFNELDDKHKQLLDPIDTIKDPAHAEAFLLELKPYVIPFKEVTEQTVKKLFPKAKKLKAPKMETIDLRGISYLGWDDTGSGKKFIIAPRHNKLVGLHGTFKPSHKKGICAICSRFEEVGMFMSETKGTVQGTFIKKGNYICNDSMKCNQNITTLDKLDDFISRIK
ncbi:MULTISPECIES: FusB/FusC family EF-G-binding protein [unclassified Peribacillus]|uniref:FusB/FusC family EF-G-binding protein n=1 Tax=unclassified Peribacillus TaxID=2675266 RepID=UPI00381CA61C